LAVIRSPDLVRIACIHVKDARCAAAAESDQPSAVYHDIRFVVEDLGRAIEGYGARIGSAVELYLAALSNRLDECCRRATPGRAVTDKTVGRRDIFGQGFRRDGVVSGRIPCRKAVQRVCVRVDGRTFTYASTASTARAANHETKYGEPLFHDPLTNKSHAEIINRG
ncbi:MAG: hypothetical protein IH628_01095, partial [Proteobacteria bacterium]|nr:hypothetical protein [Pseudomonadota bacterium]